MQLMRRNFSCGAVSMLQQKHLCLLYRRARDRQGSELATMADVSRLPRRLVMLYMFCLHACLPSPSGSFLQSSSIGGGAFSSPRLLGPPWACRAPTPRRTAAVGPMGSELEESQPTVVQEERAGTRRLEDLKVGASFTAVWPF